MTSKKEYFDDFFEAVQQNDNVGEMVSRWEKNIKSLEKGGELIPSYYKEKGKYRRVKRHEEISMLKGWVGEFRKRLTS